MLGFLLAVQFDTTIHVSDVVLFGSGILAFLRMFVTMRDAIRDLSKAVGTKNPPDGLLGDVESLKTSAAKHHDWLVAAGLDRRAGARDRRT